MNTEQQKIIKQVVADPSPLNEWEYKFINDVVDWIRVNSDYQLSDAQERALARIGGKYDI